MKDERALNIMGIKNRQIMARNHWEWRKIIGIQG